MNQRMHAVVLATLGLLATGCPKPAEKSQQAGPPPGTSLELLVLGDSALADSIGYLQTEWEAQSGVRLEIVEASESDFDPGQSPQADIVVGSSHLLGPAVEAGWVVPLPESVVQNNQANWADIFAQIRTDGVSWAGRPFAVPFGSPVPVLYCRLDLFNDAGIRPPVTWADYQAAAKRFVEKPPAEPLAPGWAGIALLARAAPYVSHRDNLSTLFSISTMDPLLASPPFVRALEELVAASNPSWLEMDPAATRAAFWQGNASMAVTWPTAAASELDDLQVDFPAGVYPLPGTNEVFDVGDDAWEKREKDDPGHVPLMAAAGRLGMVTTACKWPETAFQLLLWLTDEKWSGPVCSASPATTLFRRADLGQVAAWVERPMSDAAATQYADVLAGALEGRQHLFVLRIPGRGKYLKAMDDAVRSAVLKEKTPQEALAEASQKWKEITESLGLEEQKAAYRASLGIN